MGVKWWQSFKTSPPLDIEAEERRKRCDNRMEGTASVLFRACCELAGIEPTRRQARKWNNGTGLALRYKNEARSLL